MIIERNTNEVIFRLDASVKLDDLQALADYFLYEKIGSKSKATQAQVNALVKEAKRGRWAKTRTQSGL
jgi:hypothetical protein